MAELFLNTLTLVVILVLVVAAGLVVVILGITPGRIAKQRGHPQADAINVCSWLGVIFTFSFFILWPIALIWAYLRPRPLAIETGKAERSGRIDDLQGRINALEEQVRRLAAG